MNNVARNIWQLSDEKREREWVRDVDRIFRA